MAIVLFGAGSSMIVDVEETCARLRIDIAAIVKNVEGRDYTLSPDRVILSDDAGADIKTLQYIIPKPTSTASRSLVARRESAILSSSTAGPISATMLRSRILPP